MNTKVICCFFAVFFLVSCKVPVEGGGSENEISGVEKLIRDVSEEGLGRPDLRDEDFSFNFAIGTVLPEDKFKFSNNGGSVSSCTSNPSLPSGFGVILVNDSETPTIKSCEVRVLVQTALKVTEKKSYQIVAENKNGKSFVYFDLAVSGPQAELEDVDDLSLTINVAMRTVIFKNTGFSVRVCNITPSLPKGISIDIVEDPQNSGVDTCRISGTPTEISGVTNYEVSSVNEDSLKTDLTTAQVNIRVGNAVVPVLTDIIFNGGITAGDDGYGGESQGYFISDIDNVVVLYTGKEVEVPFPISADDGVIDPADSRSKCSIESGSSEFNSIGGIKIETKSINGVGTCVITGTPENMTGSGSDIEIEVKGENFTGQQTAASAKAKIRVLSTDCCMPVLTNDGETLFSCR